MSEVYHFTDTARLPWILTDGALRAGKNKIGGFPDPEFVWTTTDATGDSLASGGHGVGYRGGRVRLVRFTLHADDFEPWHEITKRFLAWTPDQVMRLERRKNSSNPQHWRCRVEPLASDRWIASDTRSYRDNTWRPLTDRTVIADDEYCGIVIARTLYLSQRLTGPNGQAAYSVMVEPHREIEGGGR
jgi:hypothetical protein